MSNTIRLSSGRQLGYADFGDPDGRPILYCAGGIGSRLQIAPTPEQPLPPGLRVLGVDRPGMGLSDFQPNRTLLDWPDDVAQLADALGLARFSVLGVSAGGPYALACACKIPQRLTTCGLVASASPPELMAGAKNNVMGPVLFMYRKLPLLTRLLFWWSYGRHVGRGQEHWSQLLARPERISAAFPESDRQLWRQTWYRRQALIDKMEAFRQGTRGPAYEAGLWSAPWGFRLQEVTFEKIYLWHGVLDKISPLSAVQCMAKQLPRCTAQFYENEGHSVGHYHWQEILQVIAA